MRGIGPLEIIDVTIPPQSAETHAILEAHLAAIEQRFRVMTEVMSFDDMELILITELPNDRHLAQMAQFRGALLRDPALPP